MDNIPLDKELLRKWLKAGFLEKHVLFATTEGTPQGGIAFTRPGEPGLRWAATAASFFFFFFFFFFSMFGVGEISAVAPRSDSANFPGFF